MRLAASRASIEGVAIWPDSNLNIRRRAGCEAIFFANVRGAEFGEEIGCLWVGLSETEIRAAGTDQT
ncbi:hypothetical protein GCM10019059_45430 [Camelimonas fluminis]|nr:hypothetical protein GCM10019059_45430 [Camelimonas fluminis]